MGYSIHDGARHRLSRHSDFDWQVEKGTRLLRELYEEGQELSFPRKLRVDYGLRKIQVDNAATWALLRYTPHTVDVRLGQVGGGNFLFRKHLERFISRGVGLLMDGNEPA
ncbi:MAG: hypothetical protein HY319_08120 [Armatimonadetes bacterium]|nr:hypothetical protein [Armatimonadota bacterium]